MTFMMSAKFIDKAMRKGQKDRSDEEFEEKLNSVLALYQFTKGMYAYIHCLFIADCYYSNLR